MRVPISWLKDFVKIDISIPELADRLTFSGIEVSNIEAIGIYNPQVVAGKIISMHVLEGKSHVFSLNLEVGQEKIIETVSTAQELLELTPGQSLAIALPGALLFDAEDNNFATKTVEAHTLYNTACLCTLCTEKELGINKNAHKLLLLPSSAKPGTFILDCLKPQKDWFADQVLTLEILANISRCQSIMGIAKEVAAITRQNFIWSGARNPTQSPLESSFKLQNKVPSLVKYFSLTSISNVYVKESPDLIRQRLALCGIKPINNLVDIGNYIMLETGQPVHAYDAKRLSSENIELKLSKGNELFMPITNTEIKQAINLPKDVITICAEDAVIAVGGVIGSNETAVTTATTEILLEVAHFDMISIRKSQNQLKIYTEASARFSKGVSYDRPALGFQRFMELLYESFPNLNITGFVKYDGFTHAQPKMQLSVKALNESLGTDFHPEEVCQLLQLVDVHTTLQGDTILTEIPRSRQDLAIENDLYEEVARLVGYDRMPVTMPIAPIPLHASNNKLKFREAIRDAMVLSGLNEIITYSMSTPEEESKLFYGQGSFSNTLRHVALKNPVSADKTVMRTTLIPGLLKTIAYNVRYNDSCQLFEIGNVFMFDARNPKRGLPEEPLFLSIGIFGKDQTENFYTKNPRKLDFFDLKAHVEFLFKHLKINGFSIENYEEKNHIFQPGLCGVIKLKNKICGYLGKVHPTVCNRFGIEDNTVFCAEICLQEIMQEALRFTAFLELEKFPSIKVDISLLIDSSLTAGAIVNSIQELCNNQIKNIEIIDLYQGAGIEPGKKSISLRLTLCDRAKTLSQLEANTLRNAVVEFVKSRYKAILR